MTRHLLWGLYRATAMLAMLLAGSSALGQEVEAEGDVAYRRMALYLGNWPNPESQSKDLELPASNKAGHNSMEAVPLRLRWLSDGHLGFSYGTTASPPFLELAENSASGFGLEPQGRVGRFVVRRDEGIEAVAIQSVYSPGNTRYFTQTETRWTVCLVEPTDGESPDGDGQAAAAIRGRPCQESQPDLSSFVWQIDHAPEARWMHAAVDSEGKRGFRTVSIPLLRDHDGDGYTDFVLWRRFEVSAAAVTPQAVTDDAAEFEVERHELWLLRYDPEARAFAEPLLISGPTPAASLATYQALLGSL